VLARLDQFIFTEDVQLGDVTTTFAQIAVVGPRAADVLGGWLGDGRSDVLAGLLEHGNVRAELDGHPVIVTRVTDTGEPGLDLYIDASQADAIRARLAAAEVPEATDDVAEVLRVEAGVPAFGRDMDEETIPLEAGIEPRAISFTKGCYVGQEVIIRVLHRGHGRVAKKLVGLLLDGGGVPASGTIVRSSDREIGHVTSAVRSIALDRPIALAYLHRDFVTSGTSVSVEGANATVAELPFVSPRP
jgi:folate-binding protein YgfZ